MAGAPGPARAAHATPAARAARGTRAERAEGRGNPLRFVPALAAAIVIAGCGSLPGSVDPASDAPEPQPPVRARITQAATYEEALERWRDAEDISAWVGARFEYDTSRALLLSETQRQKNGRMRIAGPQEFYASPRGVCVDLARFAVETLRAIAPESAPAYVMIEFDPVSLAGHTLRRHWVASFGRDGGRYFFADTRRPGHIAGPYASTQDFITEYAGYRGRKIVSFREAESYERRLRAIGARQARDERP